MKSTISYLDEAKGKLGIESDYGMAKWLGVSRAAVSSYRLEKTVMDDYAAAKVAEAIGVDPMEVIAAANAEREKDEDRKDYWQKYWQRLGGLAASIILAVNLIMTPTPSQAAPMLKSDGVILYIMLNRVRRLKAIKQAALSLVSQISHFCMSVAGVRQISA